MKSNLPPRNFVRSAACLLLLTGFCLTSGAAELSAQEQDFLVKYEKVRAALAADSLKDAKSAAAEMGEDGKLLAQTESIITARKEFAALSQHALELAQGQSGYFAVNCPMLKKDWVQTSEKISNPYAGREMLTCGTIKK